MTHGQEEKKEEPEPTEEILSNPCRATWNSRLPRRCSDWQVGPFRNLIDWLSGTSSSHPSSCCVLRYWRGRSNSFRSQRHDTFFSVVFVCKKAPFYMSDPGDWRSACAVYDLSLELGAHFWLANNLCAFQLILRQGCVGSHLQATAGKQKTRISASPRSKTRGTWGPETPASLKKHWSHDIHRVKFWESGVWAGICGWSRQNQDLFLENEKREEDEEKARSWPQWMGCFPFDIKF